RAVLPGPLPGPSHHARGADRRGDGAGGRPAVDGPFRRPRVQGGLLHVDRRGQVPSAGDTGGSATARTGDAPIQGPHLQDEGRGLCRRQRGVRGRDDGPGGRPVSRSLHPTVVVDPTAEIADDVEIGPFGIVGPNVRIGKGCRIAARVTLERNVRLSAGVQVGSGSILGGPPQDLKYAGEDTWVEVGERSIIREYTTINRATSATGVTSVGRDCFLMTYVHIA